MKSDVDVFLSMLQAAVDERVLSAAVDINGKLKLNAVSNDILNVQRVDESIWYDALELSFNSGDRASILNIHNIDILQYITNNAVVVNIDSKSEIDIGLNLKPDKLHTYLKTDVDVFFYVVYNLVSIDEF